MAKKAKVCALLSPIAQAIHKASVSIAELASIEYSERALRSQESASNSAQVLDIILSLRTTWGSQYATIVTGIFGNGIKGKANVKGELDTLLDAACVSRSATSQWRTVARYLINHDPVDDDGKPLSMRPLYMLAKEANGSSKGGRPTADKAAPPKTIVEAGEFEAWARENPALALEVLERAMIARKETLKAAALHAMRGDFVITK